MSEKSKSIIIKGCVSSELSGSQNLNGWKRVFNLGPNECDPEFHIEVHVVCCF